MLGGCRDDHRQPLPLAVADYRLHAIEQNASRLDSADIDDEMLSVDAEAYDRPAGAPFREAVAKFYDATHPACLGDTGEGVGEDGDALAEARAPLQDFDALVARLTLSPFRRDLDLAWEKAALGRKKQGAPRDCAADRETPGGIMGNAQAEMRDALDRMEAATTVSPG